MVVFTNTEYKHTHRDCCITIHVIRISGEVGISASCGAGSPRPCEKFGRIVMKVVTTNLEGECSFIGNYSHAPFENLIFMFMMLMGY